MKQESDRQLTQGALVAGARAFIEALAPRTDATQVQPPKFKTVSAILAAAAKGRDWRWGHYIALGSSTLLVGEAKKGKSTLVYGLLGALERGESFLGLSTKPTRSIVVSEEEDNDIAEKLRAFKIQHAEFLPTECAAQLSFAESMRLAVDRAKATRAELIVVDTFAHWGRFGEGGENDASTVLARYAEGIAPATSAGLAVLALHHSNKNGKTVNDSIRGSTAFPAVFSVNVLLSGGGRGFGVRRTLTANGRSASTPDPLVYEFQGGVFDVVGTRPQVVQSDDAAALVAVLRRSPGKPYTGSALIRAAGIRRQNGQRVLPVVAAHPLVLRRGAGTRGDPVVYLVKPPEPSSDEEAA